MKNKYIKSFITIFLSITLFIVPTTSVFGSSNSEGISVKSTNERVRELKIENNGHYIEYQTSIEGIEYRIVETISEDMKTVRSEFYLHESGDYKLEDIRIQQVSDNGEFYTYQSLMNIGNIETIEIKKPELMKDTNIGIGLNSYIWRQVGDMYYGSQGISSNATLANISIILRGVFTIAHPVAGVVLNTAVELYNRNVPRFYYHGRLYRNPAGNRARESIWAYEDQNRTIHLGNMIDEFDFYWD